jgi:hypothetical protein
VKLAWRYVWALALVACGAAGTPDPQNGAGTLAAGAGADQAGRGGASGATGGSAGMNRSSVGTAGGGGRETGSAGRSAAAGASGAGAAGDRGGGTGGSGGAPAGAAGHTSDTDILEPAQGALLGLFYGADSIAETSQKLGRALPLHLTYYAWDDDWTKGATAADLAAGRIPLVNWEPFEPKLDDIVGGTHDAMIRARASGAKALGKPFFLDFGAEMNGDWSPWGGAQNGMDAALYVTAYRHIHDLMIAGGATNIVWLWCPNVTDEPRSAWNAALNYYPGDDYVDWTCVDGYNWGATNGGWQSFSEVFSAVYAKLATKHKPIMIGEMASAEAGGDKAAWIDQIIPTLRAEFPLIKGLVWFDIDKETDWRISSSSAAEAAFARMAADPYFNP